MPRKSKSKTEDQVNMNPRNSEESSMGKSRGSASKGEDVEETTYNKDTREKDVEEVNVTDDEDEDESPRRS